MNPGRVLLIGMMGAGKSTVGRGLASRLGWAYLDSDEEVLRSTGRTIPEIWRTEGEAAFRAQESRALSEALATPGPEVVSVAGGAVLAPANRAAISAAGLVVWLRASLPTLVARVGSGEGRPLLEADPSATLERLAAERGPVYAELANETIDVDRLTPEEVIERIAALVDGCGIRRVTVGLGDRSYPVLIGPGARQHLPEVLPSGARRAAVVTVEGLPVAVDSGLEQREFFLPDGEQAKSLTSVEDLCRGFARWGLTRADVVVAVGGGVVTDTGGFAASVYHRGVAVVHVPTTLLGQVDAAIGGKTGVNLPEGKNLVGAFWQPAAVLCDTETLATLPPRERRSGLGEMAKYAFLGVDRLAELSLEEAVAACVAAKAVVVSADEREAGGRALLNYGHTLAHALETAGHYDLRHGEAVGIGLVFAARLACRLGRIDERRVIEHERVVAGYDLATRVPPGLSAEELVAIMRRDKKATSGGLTFVLDGPHGVEVVVDVPAEAVVATLDEMLGP